MREFFIFWGVSSNTPVDFLGVQSLPKGIRSVNINGIVPLWGRSGFVVRFGRGGAKY